MTTQHAVNIEAIIKAEIAAQLGFDPDNPPTQVSDIQAAEVLGAKKRLAAWCATAFRTLQRSWRVALLTILARCANENASSRQSPQQDHEHLGVFPRRRDFEPF